MTPSKIVGQGFTYDDVLLVPAYSTKLPREVSISSKFSKNIPLNIPIVSAAMDTVTESEMAIALAREGGIGVLHKNMTIEEQAENVRSVKRSESGMILDPVTLPVTALVSDANTNMEKYKIGGIPVIDDYVKMYSEKIEIDLTEEWDLYSAYNLFKLAGILQGILGRVRDGTAAHENAAERASGVRNLSDKAWDLVEKNFL